MQKILFKYISETNGQTDEVTRTLDLDLGTTALPLEEKHSKSIKEIADCFDKFITGLGLPVANVIEAIADLYIDETAEEIIPNNTVEKLDFDSFVKQFNESDSFKQTVFNVFQLYMN
jgi:hypothetical protein